jgi:hypothetical protein
VQALWPTEEVTRSIAETIHKQEYAVLRRTEDNYYEVDGYKTAKKVTEVRANDNDEDGTILLVIGPGLDVLYTVEDEA